MINKILYRFLTDAIKKSSKYFDKTYRVGTLNPHLEHFLKALPAFELETSPSSDFETSLFIIEDEKQLKILQKKTGRNSRVLFIHKNRLKDSQRSQVYKDTLREYGYEVVAEKTGLFLFRILVLRPIKKSNYDDHILSIVVPCRNERGNIEKIISELPKLEMPFEVIFVEGHSKDGTWEEIIRVSEHYKEKVTIKFLRQTGIGKANAVDEGISVSNGCLIVILDADLTVHPNELFQFIDLYVSGEADFVNGSRLIYPMEKGAMRWLNKMGNLFFAKFLSFVLRSKISDSLCGTKLFRKKDYERFLSWRKEFGDYDPFGDFNLLFPASVLCLGIKNVPVNYRARVYGSTNISRFYHGSLLLKMGLIGLYKIRLRLFSPLIIPVFVNLQNIL